MPVKPNVGQGDERRVQERAHVEIDVDLATYGLYYLSRLENISIGGVFVRTQLLQPVDTPVKLRFRLPKEAQAIEAQGKVVWVFQQSGRAEPNSSGMGIEFQEIRDEDRARIAKFIQQKRKAESR